jgi:hypothetical protein
MRGQKLSEFMLDSARARAEESILDQRQSSRVLEYVLERSKRPRGQTDFCHTLSRGLRTRLPRI